MEPERSHGDQPGRVTLTWRREGGREGRRVGGRPREGMKGGENYI